MMSEWKWQWWRIGCLKEQTFERYYFDMGLEDFVAWRVFRKLAWRAEIVSHFGRFWNAVREWERRKMKER